MATIRVNSIKLSAKIISRAANKSAAHRALVWRAIKRNLKPVLPDAENVDSITLNLVGDLGSKLDELALIHGMDRSALFSALCNAALIDVSAESRKLDENLRKVRPELKTGLLIGKNEESREPQMKFWDAISGGLFGRKLVMGEASTGVGKGRVIVSAAVLSLEQGKGPVVIAAPSIKVLSQLWGEFENPAVQASASSYRACILPGRQEFVDEIALGHFLSQNPGVDEAVENWHANGGQSCIAGSLARAGLRNSQPLTWLMEDLRSIATNLRAEDFALSESTDAESVAAQQINELRAASADAEIIFCTHTMLAIGVMTAWNAIPALLELKNEDGSRKGEEIFPVFLVDEGHLLEESFSSVFSDATSLFSLRYRIGHLATATPNEKKPAQEKVKAVIGVIGKIFMACMSAESMGRVRIDEFGDDTYPELRKKLQPLLAELEKLLAGKSFDKVKGIISDRNALKAINRTLDGKSRNPIHLSFSPDKRFPSLTTGPSTVAKYLNLLWSKAAGGAAIISASIYTPDLNGKLNCDHLRSKLALHPLRIVTPLPVIWDEIYTPCLHLPSADVAQRYIPSNSEADFAPWCATVATKIAEIAQNAAGGTLVLCTSYIQAQATADALLSLGFPDDRIIRQEDRIELVQAKFIARKDLRPVWIGVGAAWTGLDIREGSHVPPEQDRLITDLVITRLPIGLNRTNTMLSRIDRIGFRPVAQEALLTLKQGLGRLIRRAGLSNRNIWILDGRIKNPGTIFMGDLVSMTLLMISRYRNRKTFD